MEGQVRIDKKFRVRNELSLFYRESDQFGPLKLIYRFLWCRIPGIAKVDGKLVSGKCSRKLLLTTVRLGEEIRLRRLQR